MHHNFNGPYEKYIKRPQDFLCALAATIVLSPVMGVTALLVKNKLGTPVLFTQDRPGKDGKVFKLYKFRTMTDARDEKGELLPDEVRLTSFGKKLRSTSLDELPEWFNILKGDMAVVGPRPLLVRYLERYNEHQARRHEVRPGFTGLAQVNGRTSITWDQKFAYDVEYVKNMSFKQDFKIFFIQITYSCNTIFPFRISGSNRKIFKFFFSQSMMHNNPLFIIIICFLRVVYGVKILRY